MRNLKALMLTGLFCWLSGQAFGQLIKGEVIDKTTRSPIAGASILLKGAKGMTSDESGKFSFESNGAKSFTISFVGYASRTVPLTNATFYSVELEGNNKALDQVVVVGYGTQK